MTEENEEITTILDIFKKLKNVIEQGSSAVEDAIDPMLFGNKSQKLGQKIGILFSHLYSATEELLSLEESDRRDRQLIRQVFGVTMQKLEEKFGKRLFNEELDVEEEKNEKEK